MTRLRSLYTLAAMPLYVAGVAIQVCFFAAKVAWLQYRLSKEAPLYTPRVQPEPAYEKAKRDWSVN